MARTRHPLETAVETFVYEGVTFEVVERPEVVWVGTMACADNFTDEPEAVVSGALLRRYQAFMPGENPDAALVCPDWSASVSINYMRPDAPDGVIFGQETSDPAAQDARHDLYTQPGGLYMRVYVDADAARLIGKESCAAYELFGVMGERAAPAHGYVYDGGEARPAEVEYRNHTDNTLYAYIPVRRK